MRLPSGALADFGIDIGAGLGPLAGRIWRVGFMGASSTRADLALFLGALDHIVRGLGHRCAPGVGAAAAMAAHDESVATR
jgi:alanine-glyoxylate transaminase / serine-glyoxylate transaminase / serine-pyruvate transaminase